MNTKEHVWEGLGRWARPAVTCALRQEELIETITHLAFYAGWPNAVSAIAVAREVFEKKAIPSEGATAPSAK